jgi:tetratricopeptide (TPR) repeat protein
MVYRIFVPMGLRTIHILLVIICLLFLGCKDQSKSTNDKNILDNTVNKLVSDAEKYLTTDADSSVWVAQQAYHLSKDLKNDHTVKSLYILARALYNKGELYEALKYLIQAHELALNLNDKVKIPDILNLEGNIYGSLGQYDKTVDSYLNALKNYHALQNRQNEAKVLNNLGLVYYRMDQVDKAYSYHQRALSIWDSLDYQIGLGSSFTNISYIYSTRGQYNQALQYLDRALKIYKTLGNIRREANTYINYGEVYMYMNKPEEALIYFEKSLPMSQQGDFNDIYVDGLNKKGWALHKLGRLNDATFTLKKGLSMAVKIKDPSLINEINQKLTNLYSSMGDFRSALQYQQRWAAIKDSIFQDKSAEYIALFEVMYKTEAKEKRIELLEEVNKRRALLFQFSIFLAVLMLAILILLYSRYRIKVKFLEQQQIIREKTLQQKELQVELEKSKNKQLEAENKLKEEENEKLQLDIQHRHSELSSVTLHLYQKNENLSQLAEEVGKIEKQVSPENRQSIRKLKQVINRNLNLDEDWNNFRMYFNQVHHGFLDRLKTNHPELTNHDLRHCSYIRMNLSTKEISRLMNINPTSVQKSRVRLKKKLNLNQDEELYEYLLKF